MVYEIDVEVIPLSEVPFEFGVRSEEHVPLVLVVDDEPLLADTLAAVLATSGLAVAKAYSGAAALELAMQQPPDLLLSDVLMPGLDGIELAMTVARELPDCKVLLFSGHATEFDLADAREAGFDFSLIAKPMHPVKMLERVFECLGWRPQRVPLRRSAEAVFTRLMGKAPQQLAAYGAD